MAEDETRDESRRAETPARISQAISLFQRSRQAMTNTEQDRWSRAKDKDTEQ